MESRSLVIEAYFLEIMANYDSASYKGDDISMCLRFNQ